jgi:hypothetical protein
VAGQSTGIISHPAEGSPLSFTLGGFLPRRPRCALGTGAFEKESAGSAARLPLAHMKKGADRSRRSLIVRHKFEMQEVPAEKYSTEAGNCSCRKIEGYALNRSQTYPSLRGCCVTVSA